MQVFLEHRDVIGDAVLHGRKRHRIADIERFLDEEHDRQQHEKTHRQQDRERDQGLPREKRPQDASGHRRQGPSQRRAPTMRSHSLAKPERLSTTSRKSAGPRSLMYLSGPLPAGAGTSARGECSKSASANACWPMGDRNQSMNSSAALGWGPSATMP